MVDQESPFAAPQTHATAAQPVDPTGDSTGGVIPYKNPAALIAYYLGLFSMFPLLGIVLAVPALILGIKGLQNRRRNPAVKGSIHAWIGIIFGGLFSLLWGFLIVVIFFAGAN